MFKRILSFIVPFMPWAIKRFLLVHIWKYKIHRKAHIGLSYIFPDHLEMAENAIIGHLNVAIHLKGIFMAKDCIISQRNWITGFPIGDNSEFQQCPNRNPILLMHEYSAITKKHHIDCTDTVEIGAFSTVAGYDTQILTHSKDLAENLQACRPISIGHHSFVGTRSILLPGAKLPDLCVLGAGAVLNKSFNESGILYAGVPAKSIKAVDLSYKFFTRTKN